MILTVVLTGFLIIFGMFAAMFVAWRFICDKITSTITDFVSSPGPGVQSPLSQAIEAASKAAGHSIAMEVKTTLMGKASVVSKQESGIIEAIASDQMEAQQPLISGLLDTMPSLKKKLLKNPALLSSLAGLFQPTTTGSHQTAGSGGHQSTGSGPRFNFGG